MRPRPTWMVLIATAVIGAGGVAQAQTGGVRHDADAAAGVAGRIGPGTRWGSGLELSDGGRAHSDTLAEGEAYVVIRDTLGSVTVGKESGAGHRMTVGNSSIWAAGFGSSNRAGARRDWNLDRSAGSASGLGPPSGEVVHDRISYYTPRFEGFQLGLSYVPGLDRERMRSASSAGATHHDGFALGARFDRRFDRFGIGVAAGYETAEASDNVMMPDLDTWTVAARFEFGGLRVSGEFKKTNDLREDAKPLATSGRDEAWDFGARYLWGRNDVSLAYAHGAGLAVTAMPNDDELDAATLSYARTLGRGVKWSVNLYWANVAGEDFGKSDDNDGMALTTGLRLNF